MKDFKSIIRKGAKLSDWMCKMGKSPKTTLAHWYKRRCLRRSVCQDPNELVYGVFREFLVPCRPQYHEVYTDCIGKWVPDPSLCDSVKKLRGDYYSSSPQVDVKKYKAITSGGRVVSVSGTRGPSCVFVGERFQTPLSSWKTSWDYSEYKGNVVSLCPVVGRDGRTIVDLVQCPLLVDVVDRRIVGENGADQGAGKIAAVGRVIVDGSNVIFADGSKLVAGLKTSVDAITSKGSGCFVFLDANIFHKLEEMENGAAQVMMLKGMIAEANGTIALVPAGARADDFILKKADTEGCHVLSNDRYQPYLERYPWIDQGRVHRFSFVEGRLMIPDLDVDVSI